MIELVDLKKSFGDNHVLRGVHLRIETGENMVIIGGSGTGKSVILKHIIGLMKPDSGQVLVDGTDIITLPEKELNQFRKRFGMVFQSAALFDSITVGENVGFPLREHTKLPDEKIREIARQKLLMVGLKGIEDRMPDYLSGGMKKRVGMARAIAMDPKILLYDEPTTGLDPIMTDVIDTLISKMNNQLKVTSVTITHDMKSAYKIADKIAMLYEGKILEVGTPDEIRNSPNPVVRQFITGSATGPIKVAGVE
ncbi:MAG: ABC transporter ATP-binding protein [Nitrospirae bacterium]|nr:ABC transporter ATP-binding protein [Candidatus Manganitrophaceae bacterium]